MKRTVLTIIFITIVILGLLQIMHRVPVQNLAEFKLKQKYAIKHQPSVDHTQFTELQKVFESPQEVTEACRVVTIKDTKKS